jgi:subtilisin-like proprotein convertase family protein
MVLALVFAVATDASAQARLLDTAPTTRPVEGPGNGATPGIVSDPGFEAGTPNPFWAEFSQNFGTPLCTSACGLGDGTGPHSGTWWAWFGGTTAAETGFVEQSVTIPAGTADLTFWLEIPVANIPGELRVKMGATTIASYNQADTTTYATYALVTIDIDSFAGGTHMLRFEADNAAGTDVINFFVDDIQINAVPTGPSLQVSPTSINFGAVPTGTSSTPAVVTLTNNGTEAVTIVSITPVGGGYSINTTGTDLTLDPAQGTTFSVTFSPVVAGPAPGSVAIGSNAPGSPHTVTLSGLGTNYITYASADTPQAIADGPGTNIPGPPTVSTIVVPAGAPTIGDLDVDIDLTHSWVGDVIVQIAKGATTSTIYDRPGVPVTTFGCSGDNLDIIFDDQGTDGTVDASCTSGTPAYPVPGGRYIPDATLTTFAGQSAAGTWTLTVTDNADGETGVLDGWALLVTPVVAGEGTPEAGVSALSIAPNPVSSTGQVQLSVATSQAVRVALYDALGREVAVLFDGAVESTQIAYIAFETRRFAPGVYLLRATGDDFATSQRVTIAR